MKRATLLMFVLPFAACAVDPSATYSTAERNAAAEADLNRGIVCKRQSGGDFELDKTDCTTPDEREERRESSVESDLERK